MNANLAHWFRHFRAHQRKLQIADTGSLTTYPSGRTERAYAAPYGLHAASALASAKRHIAFRDRLSADVKAAKKRSAAAKRGWRKRRDTTRV